MKKLTGWMVVAVLASAFMCSCGGDDEGDGDKSPTAPQVKMVGVDIDAVHEIAQGMSVKVEVNAPAGIGAFGITITSPVLTDAFLKSVGLAAEMDLVNPATPAMAGALEGYGFPVGDAAKGKKQLAFDISELVPLIALLSKNGSDHVFTLTVTDALAQSTTKALKFHLTGENSVAYNNDADLWKNGATLKVNVATGEPEVVVEYKESTATEWQTAAVKVNADGTRTATIAPVWESSKNAAQLDVYTIKAGTGVFAGKTYKYRATIGGEAVAEQTFTTAAGNTIENGDMAGWSKKIVKDWSNNDVQISYPNAAGKSFWDSGNNMFLENQDPESPITTPLCEEDKDEAGTANLSARMVLDAVFAAGNMFTGDFVYSGMSGTASFGKAYAWTARPRALKFRYKAQVGVIDQIGGNDPEKDAYKDQQDRSRIFVAVVDWTAQHGVTSGMVAPSGMWDPATTKSVAEGAILGYGDLVISQTVGNWTEVTLPLSWYDKTAGKPAAEKFSLVISCATSFRGDYLTGCSTNFMKVDDFQWVY